MNQDLAQILTSTDSLVNSIQVDPEKANSSEIEQIRNLRNQMENRLKSYSSSLLKENENVKKELEELSRQIQQRINNLMQRQQ